MPKPTLKFYCATFGGKFVAGAAACVATDKREAKKLINALLTEGGLAKITAKDIEEIASDVPNTVLLLDGDY